MRPSWQCSVCSIIMIMLHEASTYWTVRYILHCKIMRPSYISEIYNKHWDDSLKRIESRKAHGIIKSKNAQQASIIVVSHLSEWSEGVGCLIEVREGVIEHWARVSDWVSVREGVIEHWARVSVMEGVGEHWATGSDWVIGAIISWVHEWVSNWRVSQMRATLSACSEPAGKLWQLCKGLYLFEHKTQYLLIHTPFTCIVVFWHIGNISPMIS